MDDSLKKLQEIADRGQAANQIIFKPAIVDGHRLRNDVMRGIIEKFKDNAEIGKEELLDIILKIDQKIESGELTNDLLDEIDKIINE